VTELHVAAGGTFTTTGDQPAEWARPTEGRPAVLAARDLTYVAGADAYSPMSSI
jgi:hypothetical protein